MKFEMSRDDFFDSNLGKLYESRLVDDQISKKDVDQLYAELGLRFVDYKFEEVNKYSKKTFLTFDVIDEHLFFLSRIKYGF